MPCANPGCDFQPMSRSGMQEPAIAHPFLPLNGLDHRAQVASVLGTLIFGCSGLSSPRPNWENIRIFGLLGGDRNVASG